MPIPGIDTTTPIARIPARRRGNAEPPHTDDEAPVPETASARKQARRRRIPEPPHTDDDAPAPETVSDGMRDAKPCSEKVEGDRNRLLLQGEALTKVEEEEFAENDESLWEAQGKKDAWLADAVYKVAEEHSGAACELLEKSVFKNRNMNRKVEYGATGL